MLRDGERGSALLAVLGIVAVTAIIALTVASSTIGGLGFTSSTKAAVQARAAAEAGLAVAEIGIREPGNCLARGGVYASASGQPTFTARIQRLGLAVGSTWADGCPNSTTAQVRIVSTGAATEVGIANHDEGDTRVVEATYAWLLPGPPASGAAMYMYGGVEFKNLSPILADVAVAAIQVKTGDFDCDNETRVTGDVIVELGDIRLKKCTIVGNAWTTDEAKLENSEITKDLTRNTKVTSGTNVIGSEIQWASGMAAPFVPPWVDFEFDANDWLNADGSAYDVALIGDCSLTTAKMANGGEPLILDARRCGDGINEGGQVTAANNVLLSNDVVLVAHQFSFTKTNMTFGSTTPAGGHRIWFITPDSVEDHLPTRQSPGGNFTVGNGFTIASPVNAFLYTPWALGGSNDLTWRGQVFVGSAQSWNKLKFTYSGIGLPGVNLGDGEDEEIITVARPSGLKKIRDVAD